MQYRRSFVNHCVRKMVLSLGSRGGRRRCEPTIQGDLGGSTVEVHVDGAYQEDISTEISASRRAFVYHPAKAPACLLPMTRQA